MKYTIHFDDGDDDEIDNTIYFGVTDVVMKFWVIPTCISKFVILFYRYAFFFLFCYNSVASC